MKTVFAFFRNSGFLFCALLAMVGLTAFIYLRPGSPGEESAEAFAPGGAAVPAVVYRCVSGSGERGAGGIGLAEFECDLQYIKDGGYATVGVGDLVGFACGGASLPKKPVMIVFDEGNMDSYFLVLPVIKKYGLKAVGERADIEALMPGKRRMPEIRWVARQYDRSLQTMLENP